MSSIQDSTITSMTDFDDISLESTNNGEEDASSIVLFEFTNLRQPRVEWHLLTDV
jgi:hypothetical protein